MNLDHIARVQDLRDHDVFTAVATRNDTIALLSKLASVSSPETGVAKVLLVLARMATTACGWIDGDMAIDVVDEGGSATRIDVSTEMGGGLRERVFTPLRFNAPLVEFTRAIERVPHLLRPLTIRSKSERRLTFAASAHLRRTTAPPPAVEISAESIYVRAPAPAIPKETDLPQLPLVTAAKTSEPPSETDIDGGWD